MSTSNFYNKNTSKVFAVLMPHEEEPLLLNDENHNVGNELIYPEEWEYDDLIANLRESLQKSILEYKELNICDRERNFSGKYFAEVYSEKEIAHCYICIRLRCVIRSGYYKGANLDWELLIDIEQLTYEDIPDVNDIQYIIKYNNYPNKGMLKIQSKNILKYIEKEIPKVVKIVEDIYTKFSEPLVKFATFNNGETIYKKAE
ncbi:MAG: hypothetical protein M0R17_06355 [Candidatus Omnitrophica bacterium]|jgi:hypothetical protein|nr:hypothetical protein [Candidatus Omnitrophota bacterium]